MLGLRNNLKKSIRLKVNCLINYESTNYLCNYAHHKVLRRNKKAIFIKN